MPRITARGRTPQLAGSADLKKNQVAAETPHQTWGRNGTASHSCCMPPIEHPGLNPLSDLRFDQVRVETGPLRVTETTKRGLAEI